MTQDWQDDPVMKAAAFTGSATNKAYSMTERLAMAMKAIELLEEALKARPQDNRTWEVQEIPRDVKRVRDNDGVTWIKDLNTYWRPVAGGMAIDADGRVWPYAGDTDLVTVFGPITEVPEPTT